MGDELTDEPDATPNQTPAQVQSDPDVIKAYLGSKDQ